MTRASSKAKQASSEGASLKRRQSVGLQLACASLAQPRPPARAQSTATAPLIGLGTCCLKGPDSMQQVMDGLQVGAASTNRGIDEIKACNFEQPAPQNSV